MKLWFDVHLMQNNYIDAKYDFVTKSLLTMIIELALLVRWLSITLNHGINGCLLDIFKVGKVTMPFSLLGLSSCPAYCQVEVLRDQGYNSDPSNPGQS